MESLKIIIRKGTKADSKALHDSFREILIHDIGEERTKELMSLTPEEFERDGFSDSPLFHGLVAELTDESGSKKIVGSCIYFYSYSCYTGKILYLEGLFTKAEYRQKGIGTRILKELSKIAIDNKCVELKLSVANWSTATNAFYTRRGGENQTESIPLNSFIWDSQALQKLASLE